MNLFHNSFINRTYVKYFISYLIVFTVLIWGFFFIMRSQISNRYFELLNNQTKEQLNSIASQLNDDLVDLVQVNASLEKNMLLISSQYKEERQYYYYTSRELNKYVSTSKLISSICYMNKGFNNVVSTLYDSEYSDDKFVITKDNGNSLVFDPAPYFNAFSGQLLFVSDENTSHLIYFPSTSSKANYIYFYMLDIAVIQQQMKFLATDTMPAIALIDADRQFVTAVNSTELMPYMQSFELEDGIYELDSSTSICVCTGISNGFSMISLISNDSLLHQINAAFTSSYLTLVILGTLGFLLILFAMRITYMPLHKLTHKIVSDSDPKLGYLEQLDSAFATAEEQNQLLKSKLDNYRISMKKSLLDSIFTSNRQDQATALPNIDQFFDTESDNEIYAIKIASLKEKLPYLNIQKYFRKMLPGNDPCIILEAGVKSVVFLINYIGTELNKDEVLIELLYNLHEEYGYLSAISNGSSSPMDIPSLYENVTQASNYWDRIQVVAFKSLPPVSSSFGYPYDKLEQLAELLNDNNFSETRILLNSLFQVIDHTFREGNNLMDFFVRCILVDILTIIINSMNQANLTFKSYCDLYFETLYFCRSFPYSEKAAEITDNTMKLLDFYEKELSGKIVNPAQISQFIEKSYCDPNFSISMMADHFQVSIAYMSYRFKKELNQNFLDYLWALRLEKAKELLKSTDMSIDEISTAVGYINTASFRRKFKQETGITPSQFRMDVT